ncbi:MULTISPECIES: hypothetical protein [Burkholderia cepacia complex]|uniref:hypothetical protein n=1 Tax=Burkholderia cepacia complex TaxID=87882 RepID=UPI000052DC7E|nr:MULTISPECIES: hypothetical protein [Burkholderia cepacia complex]ABK06951.1 hypothetical protein Bcen2424_0197 [Burkholderia cenocepacia HI2424]MBJ9727692.1 hypothetical protein [Burkholderia cenocepacia]MDN7915808.1 hypothetical protein [Burkholderia cepacia]MDR5663663.1 hypothetical protein [Burkholderia cenocepacia]MDR8025323.1 hypothetical protein [Burkholderia cenocepacia]
MQEQAQNVRNAAQTVFPLFVIVGIFGLGIWPVMYLSMREKRINEALGAELIPHWVSVTQVALLGTTLFLKFFGGWIDSDDIVGLSVLTSLAMGVMWIVFAFRAKATLERVVVHQWQITGYRLNPVWTFFFSLFYIVYCLNDLPEAVRRASPIQQPVA